MLASYIASRMMHAMATGDRQLLDLDKVCLRCVLSWLPVQTLASAACVCRKWREIAAEDALWGLSLTQGVGEFYGYNAAQQLPEVAAGLVLPHPTSPHPPPLAMLLRHAARASEHDGHAWRCRSVGRMASAVQMAAPCYKQPGRAPPCPRRKCDALSCSPTG